MFVRLGGFYPLFFPSWMNERDVQGDGSSGRSIPIRSSTSSFWGFYFSSCWVTWHDDSPFLPMAKKQKELSDTKSEGPAAQDAAPVKRKPVQTIRVDDCSASIWEREFTVKGKPTKFISISFERSYKDRDGAWKYTKSFDPESLGAIVNLCQQASEAIKSLQQ